MEVVMRRVRAWLLAAAMALGGLPGTALAASEVDILLDKLVEKGVLSGVEAGLIRREISETKETRNKELAKEIVPSSARNWNWKGDIRLRNEYRDREGTGQDAHRQRIRFRYGVEAKVSDQLKVNARIATGTSSTGGESLAGDPVSTNQSFNTSFLKKNINLDLANLEYSPLIPGVTKLSVIGGILENPFWSVSPMVFDGDLSFDGAAVKLSQDVGPTTFFANAGVFSLDNDPETEVAALWMGQTGVSVKPFAEASEEVLKNFKVTAALGYEDYNNVAKGEAAVDLLSREGQNRSTIEDFNQINPSVEVASMISEVPFSAYADWVHNTSANEDNDGYNVGVKLNKATVPWDLKKGWEGGYFFQVLERDAVYDEFSDSDFNDGGTNNRGHVFWLTLATLKNSTLGLKYINARQLDRLAEATGKDHEDRMQLDWVTKF